MAFGRNKKEIEIAPSDDTAAVKDAAAKVNKSAIILDALKEGPKTTDELMTLIGVTNKTGLFGQIAVLNTRALNKYEALLEAGVGEAADALCEFPLTLEDGTRTLGTYAQFSAKKTPAPKRPAKTYTAEQMLETAQKRCVKTDKVRMSTAAKAAANPDDAIYAMKASIAEQTHILALNLLTAVEAGNYEYERGSVCEAPAE